MSELWVFSHIIKGHRRGNMLPGDKCVLTDRLKMMTFKEDPRDQVGGTGQVYSPVGAPPPLVTYFFSVKTFHCTFHCHRQRPIKVALT